MTMSLFSKAAHYWMLAHSPRNGNAVRAHSVVSNRPTCQMSCGARKRQNTRQSRYETGPSIMVVFATL